MMRPKSDRVPLGGRTPVGPSGMAGVGVFRRVEKNVRASPAGTTDRFDGSSFVLKRL